MPPLTSGVDTWRGMPFYGPTPDPPIRPSLLRCAVRFAAERIDFLLTFTLCVLGVLAVTRGVA